MPTPKSPEALIQQITQIQLMERGTLSILRQGPEGPYYKLQAWEDGKNRTRYVPREQVPALKEAIAGYQQFHELAEQYAQLIIDETRAKLAADSKKSLSLPRVLQRPER